MTPLTMKIPIADAEELKKHGVRHTTRTFYDWRLRGLHSEIFSKIGGKVFLDLTKYNEIGEGK